MTTLIPNNIPELNKPFMTPILKIQLESVKVKSFFVKYNPLSEPVFIRPGQFVMVWVPGVDEIPMSISRIGPDFQISISVADVGDATHKLHNLKEGDLIGIRGPYGNSYEIKQGTAIILGGGIGMASLLPLIKEIIHINKAPKKKSGNSNLIRLLIIEGPKTKNQLLFSEEIYQLINDSCSADFCTDDGTLGFKGFSTDKLSNILQTELESQNKNKFNSPITVYSCGPEVMLAKTFRICENLNVILQASLERMMRCGFGICGLCALEPTGHLVCRDGPIFHSEILRKITDFGKITRDFSGKSRPL